MRSLQDHPNGFRWLSALADGYLGSAMSTSRIGSALANVENHRSQAKASRGYICPQSTGERLNASTLGLPEALN